MIEKINGKITYIIYQNTNNEYIVATFKSQEYGNVTISGIVHQLNTHFEYELEGSFEMHQKYGMQFKISSARKKVLTLTDNIIAYLSGNEFKGIGVKTATKIVELFKENTIEILKNDVYILEQHGFKSKHIEAIKAGIDTSFSISNDIIRLKELGINDKVLKNAKAKFGDNFVDVLINDIYYASRHIKGLSCNMADFYIQSTNKAYDHFSREASLLYEKLRNDFFQSGNTYEDYSADRYNLELIELLIKENLIFIDEERLYLKPIYESELFVAQFIAFFLEKTIHVSVEKEIAYHELVNHIQYDNTQKDAIRKFFNEKILIVSGGPGTGKTTITKAMVDIYKQKYSSKIAICAPTGRAAKRISELVNVAASTIHRLLKWDMENDSFGINENNPLDIDLLIIDEASMIDCYLFASLLKACTNVKKILIIGDKDQLPSIAPGKVLQDLLEVNEIPRILLQKNHRQSEGNGIIDLAYDVNQQLTLKNYDNVLFHQPTLDKFFEIIEEKLHENREFQVLSCMYRGIFGIDNLNQLLQEKINPATKTKPEIKVGHKIYRLNDKVLQLKNQVDDNVYNGDIGTIIAVDIIENEIVVDFDGNIVNYTKDNFDSITLGYCISVHKSQGSEYASLILCLSDAHYFMFEKTLIYTAVTRSKNELIVFGNKDKIEQAINSIKLRNRKTTLNFYINKIIAMYY